MRVGIGSDHGGFLLKQEITEHLRSAGYDVVDFGAYQLAAGDDYPDYVIPLARAVAAAHMPIEGLAFDDEGVTYNGLPFRQCSASEQLRVSVAMCMAVNPTVRVIRITDGSLLDSDSLALIAEMAGANDFQVWCEVVDESGQLGITIEDGSVVAP